jgi:L-alanine-DL-glutamate epimerase-like enolase superfamily enzyme
VLPQPGEIIDVGVATVRGDLPAPVVFGDWIMTYREFAVVRVRLASGTEGWAFTLTRDGSVPAHVRDTLARVYLGTSVADREATYLTAWSRSPASHGGGIGLRALSIVDLACWDAAAKLSDQSIASLLGGRLAPMPVTAIIGYPPALTGPVEIEEQVRSLHEQGWRRFKAPVGASDDLSIQRLAAARRAAPDCWLGCDGAWIYRSVDSAAQFAAAVRGLDLGWIEDMMPPGDAVALRELRDRIDMKLAMGDEQGGSYYPQALIREQAVDVVRVDLTCMGGISGGRRILTECLAAGMEFAPHMFAHVHSQVFAAWGYPDVPVEWGVPWTGVDPYADSLRPPAVRGGVMEPLDEQPGFGPLVNRDWIATQTYQDPDNIFDI